MNNPILKDAAPDSKFSPINKEKVKKIGHRDLEELIVRNDYIFK